MDAVYSIDDIAQEIAVDHAVDRAAKDRDDHVTAITAVDALQAEKAGEQAGTFLAVGADGFIVVHKLDQLIAGDAVGLGGPVAPAIGRFDGGAEALAGQLHVGLADLFQVVQELQEHDPGEHRQAVEVAVQSLVLAHDVARGLDE